jgi:rhomboid protease GluP
LFKNSQRFMPTYILIAANVAVYIVTSYYGGSAIQTNDSAFSEATVLYAPFVFHGEWWRMITSMFVHADIAHIAGNMLFLFIYGLRAEKMFDLKEYMAIYFLSGLAGNALTLLTDFVSLGASGAIFGVLGAVMIYSRRSIGQSILTAVIYAFFLFTINIGPNVNIWAHLGGLVVGLALGYLFATSRKPSRHVTYQYNFPNSYG